MSYEILDERVVWSFSLFVDLELGLRYCPLFGEQVDVAAIGAEQLRARLPEVKRWLMGLPVNDCVLMNALCMLLPFVAELDPAFARLALDPETWRTLTLADRGISEEERANRLLVLDKVFGHIVNNALLHVMATLACNRFDEIRRYLDHPNLQGGYTYLMPHYLFAVLFEKVRVLSTMPCQSEEF